MQDDENEQGGRWEGGSHNVSLWHVISGRAGRISAAITPKAIMVLRVQMTANTRAKPRIGGWIGPSKFSSRFKVLSMQNTAPHRSAPHRNTGTGTRVWSNIECGAGSRGLSRPLAGWAFWLSRPAACRWSACWCRWLAALDCVL